jgi:hypothetical protein
LRPEDPSSVPEPADVDRAIEQWQFEEAIEQWQVEEALELAFLASEPVSVTRRVVGFLAAVAAAVAGIIGTIWVFDNVGLGLGLLSVYSLPLFVLLVMLGVERTVPLGKS